MGTSGKAVCAKKNPPNLSKSSLLNSFKLEFLCHYSNFGSAPGFLNG